jgi:hypothetical protein
MSETSAAAFCRSCFLYRGMVRNEIPRVGFYFCSTERNSELFSLPLNGSEGNSESLHLFLVHGTEFRAVFSSAEGFGTEFREFLFRGTAGIPSEITICSVYSVFRGIIFLSEIPNPTLASAAPASVPARAPASVSAHAALYVPVPAYASVPASALAPGPVYSSASVPTAASAFAQLSLLVYQSSLSASVLASAICMCFHS